jgi:acetoin:2,6-dichlorophenolindophenol oxidoreductase subunit beta
VKSTRELKFSEALGEATLQAMEENPKIFLMGEGIDDPKGAFGTTSPAQKKFGKARVWDSPLAESAVTGIGIGAAIEGYPCLMVHMRAEFLLLALDQVINHAAKWHYMFGGQLNVPIVIRCIVGRGWGQAAQHSQSFHGMLAGIPGLKVILPATPYDAKGLMIAALRDPNPVISIEHRWLYDKKGIVPEELYEVPIGKARVVAEGRDVTCVATSFQVYEALAAREALLKEGIEMEVVDLRSVLPLDKETILNSVRRTGKLIVTDIAHKQFGITAEVSALVAEEGFDFLQAPIVRIALPHVPTPCSPVLENSYYPKVDDIVIAARKLSKRGIESLPREVIHEGHPLFTGPF